MIEYDFNQTPELNEARMNVFIGNLINQLPADLEVSKASIMQKLFDFLIPSAHAGLTKNQRLKNMVSGVVHALAGIILWLALGDLVFRDGNEKVTARKVTVVVTYLGTIIYFIIKSFLLLNEAIED
jgi:hypothetical protein